MKAVNRRATRSKKKLSIRGKISGTPERPRLSVYRSLQHISVQAIDDVNGVTIAASSSQSADMKGKISGSTGNKAAAEVVGTDIGEKLKGKGIETVVFDRNGYLYHGRVKALADKAREAGLVF